MNARSSSPAALQPGRLGDGQASGQSATGVTGLQPPDVLRVIAALTIAYGAAAIVSTTVSPFRGDFSVDLGFLGIPIGRGLLAGRHRSHWWAIRLSGIGFLISLFLSLSAFGVFGKNVSLASITDPSLRAVPLCLDCVVCALIFFGLRSASVRAWLASDRAHRADGFRWTLPIALVGLLYSATSAIQDHLKDTAIRGLFRVDTHFVFLDAATSAPLASISALSDVSEFPGDRRDPLAAQIQWAWINHNGGQEITVTGTSYRPIDFSFTSNGFTSSTYRLSNDSPKIVTVKLQRSP